jgi:cysteinyl-tRNA synthetase
MKPRLPRLADRQNCASFAEMVRTAQRQANEPHAVTYCLSGVADYIEELEAEVCRLQRAAGIDPQWRSRADTIEEIEGLIAERVASFQRKDHATCHQVSLRLERMGVIIEDHPAGTRWRLKSAG